MAFSSRVRWKKQRSSLEGPSVSYQPHSSANSPQCLPDIWPVLPVSGSSAQGIGGPGGGAGVRHDTVGVGEGAGGSWRGSCTMASSWPFPVTGLSRILGICRVEILIKMLCKMPGLCKDGRLLL